VRPGRIAPVWPVLIAVVRTIEHAHHLGTTVDGLAAAFRASRY
jgi:hypothetical protein